MGYDFARHLLLRMPRRESSAYTTDPEVIISDPVLRTAILLASPAFYARLQASGFRAGPLSEKEKVTLVKYYNRFCFRPTPFGLFSSVTLATWGEYEGHPCNGAIRYRAAIRPDQVYQAAFMAGVTKDTGVGETVFDLNPSIYRVLKEFRFLRTGLEENLRTREYSLQSIAFSRLLKDLLHFCKGGMTGMRLTEYTVAEAGCTPEEGAAYIEFLADAQVLLNRARPNITGEDFLFRLPHGARYRVAGTLL